MELYSKIKRRCTEKGTTIHAIERNAGFPRGSICKWDDHQPSIAKVKTVADALGVTVDELIKEEG